MQYNINKTKAYIILIFSTILFLAIIISYNNTETQMGGYEHQIKDTKEWLLAAKNNNLESAFFAASNLIKSYNFKDNIPQAYINIFQKNGLSPQFLKKRFNKFDYQLWQDALFFKSVSNETLYRLTKEGSNNDSKKITALFNLVHKRIKKGDPPRGTIIWPFAIWHFKKGLCDRQAWVLCELAYQAGYETQLIYLRDPVTLISPHTICEIRKEDKKWLADPFSGILLENTSLFDLDSNDELKAKIWPNNKRWQTGVKNAIYWTPSYPQDYCERNQLLYKALFSILKHNTPRFGEDPELRRKKFISLIGQNRNKKYQFQLWFTPIRLLTIQQKYAPRTEKTNNQN